MDRTCSTRADKLLSWSPTLQPELNLLHLAAHVIKQKLSALFPQLPDISVPAEAKANRMVYLTAISVHAVPVAPRRIPTAPRIEQGRKLAGPVVMRTRLGMQSYATSAPSALLVRSAVTHSYEFPPLTWIPATGLNF